MPKVGMEEIRKRQVVEATIRCIQKHGLEHLTMKKIAREAQVSTGIIYHYFDNKDHLLLTVLKYVFSKSDTDVSVLVEPITSPQQKIAQTHRTHAHRRERERDLLPNPHGLHWTGLK